VHQASRKRALLIRFVGARLTGEVRPDSHRSNKLRRDEESSVEESESVVPSSSPPAVLLVLSGVAVALELVEESVAEGTGSVSPPSSGDVLFPVLFPVLEIEVGLGGASVVELLLSLPPTMGRPVGVDPGSESVIEG